MPANEKERLRRPRRSRAAGARPEAPLDAVAALAAALFQAPVGAVCFVDADRVRLEARVGLDVSEMFRNAGACAHTILRDEPTVVADLLADARFASSPRPTGSPGVRFYAGTPLIAPGGERIGTLCVMDVVPRPGFSNADAALLAGLASLVVDGLELRRPHRVNRVVRGFADATSDALLCIDPRGMLTFVNPAALRLFGYAAEEMLGRNIDMIVPAGFRDAHRMGVARCANGSASKLAGKPVELRAVRKGGDEIPIELSISIWRDRHGIQMGAIVRDITERKQRECRLHRLASQDALTGLANRSRFDGVLGEACAACAPVSVLLLDLDDIQAVNDGLGHAAGDALLQAFAIRLQATLDADAVPARIGGDEFAVALPGLGDPLRLGASAQAILTAFEAPVRVLGHAVQVGISIGASIGPLHGEDAEELMASADLALTRAKADGKHGFRLFEPAMRTAVAARRALQDELRRAVANREFVLHYQPQVELGSGRVIGAEALLRWRHPERGLLAPGVFMSELERHALAAEVGTWTLDEACRQAAAWFRPGVSPVRMSVNLFAAQVRGGSLAAVTAATLERHGLAAAALELEITETIAIQNDERVLGPLRAVRALGVGLAFDDFGTGYASLSTLKRVPLSTLKIDRGFVRDLHSDPHDLAVVEAVIGMGRRLGLDVVAEGIETREQERLLMQLGCPAGQGFLYGRAMPGDEFARLCSQHASTRPDRTVASRSA